MNSAIELAKASDYSAVTDITEIVWLDTYPNDVVGITLKDIQEATAAFRANSREERFVQLISNPQKYLVVARVDGKTVGFIYARIDQTPHQIQSCYVLPEYQNQGIGGMLMRGALEWLGNDKDIVLGVATYNKKAIGFYEHFGFIEHGIREDPASWLPSGKRIPEIEMILKSK